MLKPWELDELTLAEFAWLIEYDPNRPEPFAGRGLPMGADAIAAEMRRWGSLTPRQRLEEING